MQEQRNGREKKSITIYPTKSYTKLPIKMIVSCIQRTSKMLSN